MKHAEVSFINETGYIGNQLKHVIVMKSTANLLQKHVLGVKILLCQPTARLIVSNLSAKYLDFTKQFDVSGLRTGQTFSHLFLIE